MFSLCIPTLDRFDHFLSKNLPEYILNDLISEIIISDENGNDYAKIVSTFSHDKIKVYKNDYILGPFLNKLNCVKHVRNKWVALIDSDNFADYNYFYLAKKYIDENKIDDYSIIAPSFAKPNFDYRHLQNNIITKLNLSEIENFDKNSCNMLSTVMNTGNYIINSELLNSLNITEEKFIQESSSCDVIYMNTLLFEQFDIKFHIVENLHYTHTVHDGSIYLQTYQKYQNTADMIRERFKKLII